MLVCCIRAVAYGRMAFRFNALDGLKFIAHAPSGRIKPILIHHNPTALTDR